MQPADRLGLGKGRQRVRQDVVQDRTGIRRLGGMGEGGEIIRWKAGQRPGRQRDGLGALPGRKAEFVEQGLEACAVATGPVDEGAKLVALAHDFAEKRVEPRLAAVLQKGSEGVRQFDVAAACAGDHVALRGREKGRLHLRIEHFEMRRDIGLERELVQHRSAKGVDGLDLQAARRLQRLGEQPARPAHQGGVGRLPVECGDLRRKLVVGQFRPLRQGRENPVRHIGGGGARIGQAQYLRWIGAAQRRRTTRSESTCVLPEPALADTQAEFFGSEARAWLSLVSGGTG